MSTTRKSAAKSKPPDKLPIYRLLSGAADATFNGKQVIVAQTVIWPTATGSIAVGGSKPRAKRTRTR